MTDDPEMDEDDEGIIPPSTRRESETAQRLNEQRQRELENR